LTKQCQTTPAFGDAVDDKHSDDDDEARKNASFLILELYRDDNVLVVYSAS
jgi:hypothetical protein